PLDFDARRFSAAVVEGVHGDNQACAGAFFAGIAVAWGVGQIRAPAHAVAIGAGPAELRGVTDHTVIAADEASPTHVQAVTSAAQGGIRDVEPPESVALVCVGQMHHTVVTGAVVGDSADISGPWKTGARRQHTIIEGTQ